MAKTSKNDTDLTTIDPASKYGNPQAVLSDTALNRDQKIEVLKQWEYDAREIQVATEENMAGTEDEPVLDQILKALNALNAESDNDSATKQGGG